MRKLKTVLLIDDDEDDNYFHRLVLEESGVTGEVVVAQSGPEALDLFENKHLRPELIFLDINMPKINGWEFLEQFVTIYKNYKPVIVVLTTSMSPSDKKRAEEVLTIDLFETKPLTAEKLASVISGYFLA